MKNADSQGQDGSQRRGPRFVLVEVALPSDSETERKPVLTREALKPWEKELLIFENTSPHDLKKIWKRPYDVDYDREYLAQETLPYKWDDPLYMKMIHRFRNCHFRLAQFYYQIDVNNQDRLLQSLLPGFYRANPKLARETVEFLAWISNMIGQYDIEHLLADHAPQAPNWTTEMIALWKNKPILFFISLSDKMQTVLLERYNKEVVASYNAQERTMSRDDMKAFLSGQITDLESMNVEDDVEASDSLEDDVEATAEQEAAWKALNEAGQKLVSEMRDYVTAIKTQLTPKEVVCYRLTGAGEKRFDLLGERASATPEGIAFRALMTAENWQMEQLLTMATGGPYSREEFLLGLQGSAEGMQPQIHRDMIPRLDDLLSEAVGWGYLVPVPVSEVKREIETAALLSPKPSQKEDEK